MNISKNKQEQEQKQNKKDIAYISSWLLTTKQNTQTKQT